jgi:hypothetical protein
MKTITENEIRNKDKELLKLSDEQLDLFIDLIKSTFVLNDAKTDVKAQNK